MLSFQLIVCGMYIPSLIFMKRLQNQLDTTRSQRRCQRLIRVLCLPKLEQHRDWWRTFLIGSGFLEVITDGFYGRTEFDKLGLPSEHVLQKHVETQNSLDKGYSLLKNNCLLQAVDCVRKNMHRNYTNIKVYEWTRTFHLNPEAENGVCDEQLTFGLWFLVLKEHKRGRERHRWLLHCISKDWSLNLGFNWDWIWK